MIYTQRKLKFRLALTKTTDSNRIRGRFLLIFSFFLESVLFFWLDHLTDVGKKVGFVCQNFPIKKGCKQTDGGLQRLRWIINEKKEGIIVKKIFYLLAAACLVSGVLKADCTATWEPGKKYGDGEIDGEDAGYKWGCNEGYRHGFLEECERQAYNKGYEEGFVKGMDRAERRG